VAQTAVKTSLLKTQEVSPEKLSDKQRNSFLCQCHKKEGDKFVTGGIITSEKVFFRKT
jgi:hypothetical protein